MSAEYISRLYISSPAAAAAGETVSLEAATVKAVTAEAVTTQIVTSEAIIKPLPLRAHHGMCLHYYSGHGYSPAFVEYMNRLSRILRPEVPVCLTIQADTICAVCPNCQNGLCAAAERVEAYDRAVLAYCHLHPGQILSYSVLQDQVQERVLRPRLRRRICGDCQWNAFCNGKFS